MRTEEEQAEGRLGRAEFRSVAESRRNGEQRAWRRSRRWGRRKPREAGIATAVGEENVSRRMHQVSLRCGIIICFTVFGQMLDDLLIRFWYWEHSSSLDCALHGLCVSMK